MADHLTSQALELLAYALTHYERWRRVAGAGDSEIRAEIHQMVVYFNLKEAGHDA